MVVWVLILCWDLENYKAPSGVTSGTKATRGFTDIFIQKKAKIFKVPLLPPIPETLPFSGNQHPPQGPSSLPTPYDHLQQGRPPCFSVYLQHMQQVSSTHLENFNYGHRIIFAISYSVLCFHRSNHQQF